MAPEHIKVLLDGDVCIDHNTSRGISYIAAGSPLMFIESALREFPDVHTTLVAPHATDFTGYLTGITIYPLHPTLQQTLVYENISVGGERTQKAHHRECAIPVAIDKNIEKMVGSSDIVVVAPLLPNYPVSYIESLHSHMKRNALLTLLPQGYFRDFDDGDTVIFRDFKEARDLIKFLDVVIVSERDYRNMHDISRQWAASSNCIFVVTMAEKGAKAYSHGDEIMLPTIPVPQKDIIDSVGAGDTFAAGFIIRYHQTHNIEEAGRFANALARRRLTTVI